MPIARFAIPTELAPMCLHWSLVLFYVSLGWGQCRSLVEAAEKAFGTLPVSPNLIPLLESRKAYQVGIALLNFKLDLTKNMHYYILQNAHIPVSSLTRLSALMTSFATILPLTDASRD